jgi:hypothetical protein
VLFDAFGCLTKQEKAFGKNFGHDAFRRWTLRYDPAILALSPLISAFSA